MGTIKVFLSSSKDLLNDREKFEISLYRENTMLAKRGILLELIKWEYSDDTMSTKGSQEEYNTKVRGSDIFVLMYSLKVGKYTLDEFRNGRTQFEATGKPVILIYYKEEQVSNKAWSEEDRHSVDEFNRLMADLGHFPTAYKSGEELWFKFRHQIELIINPPGPKIVNHNVSNRPYGKNLIGRRDYIDQILKALQDRHCIAIEGISGIGKTSVALELAHIFLGKSSIKNELPFEFNYIVWLSGKDKPAQKLWFNDVLDTIAETLNHSSITQISQENLFFKKKEVEKLLRSEAFCILLMIDNYETISDFDLESWLTSLPEPNKVLITSQTQFSNAYTIDLKRMKEDEAKELLLKFAEEKGLDHLKNKTESELLSLVKITGCNPLAMKMAVGYIRGGKLKLEQVVEQLATYNPTQQIELIFKKLHEASWTGIGEDAQKVLLVTPLFVGVSSIDSSALQAASGLDDEVYERAVETLLRWKLLEIDFDENNRYITHPTTRGFATHKLIERKEFEYEARNRWCSYFTEFIRERIKRDQPNEHYWNALVDERMELIDSEWTSINEVLKWVCSASTKESYVIILDMVMLLVHYMDSRFYNLERLTYVRHAIEAAQMLNRRYEEALLRIDALGWTYVEENRFAEAVEEIMTGIRVAKELIATTGHGNELLALGYSWCARAFMEEGIKVDEAISLLSQARVFEENSQSWILFRILMASGDIYLKQGEKDIALIHYQQAREKMQDYGGEGNYYQINPRIGLAYLALDQLEEAEKIFKALANQQKISIGKLYGEYGLALITFKKRNTEDAKLRLKKIKDELTRRTSSNLLLNLITEFEKSLNVAFNPASLLPDRKYFISSMDDSKTGLYVLKNKSNMYLAVTNYGARIVSLLVPDKENQIRDVIIGPASLQEFTTATERYFGATIGRFSNRIANGKFKIDNIEYLISRNEKGKTTLHGGFKGFQSVVWDVQQLGEATIQMNYVSKDGEEGFPGNLDVVVVMSLVENNELQITYTAQTDKKTIVSLTNHALFNLNGQEGNAKIMNHHLQINANNYTPVDNELIPLGKIEPVINTPFDFTEPVLIGSKINDYNTQLRHAHGYDHNFVLNKKQLNSFDLAAKVFSPESGIQLELYTTEPCLQFYSGNAMKGNDTLKWAKADEFRNAFVLEPQQFPDAPNQPNFPTTVIEAGKIFTSKTSYKFSVV